LATGGSIRINSSLLFWQEPAKIRHIMGIKGIGLLRFIQFDFYQFSIFEVNYTQKIAAMFGDIMGMMGKLKETQKKVQETKERLNTVMIDEQSSDGLLKVTLTANREIKSISIDDSLLKDKEQLEDYLVLTLNKAIEKATSVNEAELAAVAKEGMPNIPGMDAFMK
jgi:DNA-binding YbaB/EbfC family protein